MLSAANAHQDPRYEEIATKIEDGEAELATWLLRAGFDSRRSK